MSGADEFVSVPRKHSPSLLLGDLNLSSLHQHHSWTSQIVCIAPSSHVELVIVSDLIVHSGETDRSDGIGESDDLCETNDYRNAPFLSPNLKNFQSSFGRVPPWSFHGLQSPWLGIAQYREDHWLSKRISFPRHSPLENLGAGN